MNPWPPPVPFRTAPAPPGRARGGAGREGGARHARRASGPYGRRPLILTPHRAPGRFDTLVPKGRATDAVDRLLHHAHVIVTEGRSHRRAEALDGRGVQPLVPAEAG